MIIDREKEKKYLVTNCCASFNYVSNNKEVNTEDSYYCRYCQKTTRLIYMTNEERAKAWK